MFFVSPLAAYFAKKMSVSPKWVTGVTRILGDHVTVTTKNTVGFTGEVHKKQHHNLKD